MCLVRISVEDALAHPYLAAFHDPTDEPVSEKLFDFEFERETLSEADVKQLIFEEVVIYNPSAEKDELRLSRGK